MDPRHWKQVEQLLQSALDRAPADREAFVHSACGGDRELERQIQALLKLEQPAEDFMQQLAGPRQDSANHPISGTVSHYRVIEKLGGGGMGVVYKAEDSRLHRFVALKFLSDDLARNPDALKRFTREARAASALNHPHIGTIYDIGEQDGRPFIVMEFLDGTDLKDRIKGHSVEIDQLVSTGIDIADGLDAAHGAGIIHRDIKPANIFITRTEQVKILDFGLAKLGTAGESDSAAKTMTAESDITGAGIAPGTLSYMSPEQVRGKPLDARTDLFSFGVVLYEMATGTQPFRGKSAAMIFDAILNDEPTAVVRLNPNVPQELERIVQKCLEKDRELRYQSASEIRADLRRMQRNSGSERNTPAPATSPPLKSRAFVLTGAALAAVLAAGSYFYLHRAPKFTNTDTIVLADFANPTGDSVFDNTLRQGLAAQLAQSPSLSVVSDQSIQHVLGLMGQPADAKLTPKLAREICERTGGAAVLEGSIKPIGSQFVVAVTARDCRNGEIRETDQAQPAKKEDVLNALTGIASKFRIRAGESQTMIERDPALADASTPSLEAFQAYSTGIRVSFSAGPAASIPFFQKAIAIDPKFALAHAALGHAYGNSMQPELSIASVSEAHRLRDRAGEHERFFIDFNYDLEVTGNLQKARQTAESWAQTYPRDPTPHGLVSFVDQSLGKYEASLEEAQKCIDLDVDPVFGYNNLAWTYAFLNRPSEAEKTLARASELKLYTPEYLILQYYAAFLRKDTTAMENVLNQSREKSGVEDWMYQEESFALGYAGRLDEARTMSRRAAELAMQTAQKDKAALYEAGAAVREGFFGNTKEANRHATAALVLSKSRDVEYGAAFTFAISGEVPRAEAIANDLEKRFPEDTIAKFTYVPVLRALAALNRKDPLQAIDVLKSAGPYDLAIPGCWPGFFGNMYSSYTRGRAFLDNHQASEATAEFQRILDNPGIAFADPVGPMARIGLGKAWLLAGDKAKAKAAYQDFLTLWKGADPNVPALIQAKADFAKLE